MARCTKNTKLPLDPAPLTLGDLRIGDTFAYRRRVTRVILQEKDADYPDRFMLTTAGVVCTRGAEAGRVTIPAFYINKKCEVFDVFRAGLRVHSTPQPVEATYTLELSQDEAQALRNVCGAMGDAQDVTGSVRPIYFALVDVGLKRTDDPDNMLVLSKD